MFDPTCVLCKAIASSDSSKVIYEDDYVISFREEWYPVTDAHAIVIPKKHIENIMDVEIEDKEYIFHAYFGIQKAAMALRIDETGFRVVTNNGRDAEQEVRHLHYHVIGGRKLKWEF